MAATSAKPSGSALIGQAFGTFKLPDEFHFVVERAAGAVLESTDGATYLDCVLGSGPLVLGHSHPRVVEAIQAQASRGCTFYALNEPALQLADRVAALVPCADAVKLVGSGSEAAFYACRIARAATGRPAILKFEGAYHGHNDYSLHSLTPAGDHQRPNVTPASAGIPPGVSETVVVAPYNDLAATEKILERHAEDVAAVIVEPVQRAFEPLSGFLDGLRAACDRVGALLIFDEVVTGFRLDIGGAQRVFGVIPDLCALGKAVGGGLPLAALAGRRDLLELSVPGAPAGTAVYLSGTLNGNPLAAAAGLATLDVLEEEAGCAALARTGAKLAEGLVELGRRLSVPLQTIGPPSFPQPVFGDEQVIDPRSLARTNQGAARAFGYELIRRHVFVHPANKIYICTAHTEELIDRFLATAYEALLAVRAAGMFEDKAHATA